MKPAMLFALRRLLHSLPIPAGRRRYAPRLKPAPFAAFSVSPGFQMHRMDHYERSARRWRAAKWVFIWATAFLAAWITLESMRALSMA